MRRLFIRAKEIWKKTRLYDFLYALGDLLMPRACLACGCRLGMRERHLCLACAADVPYTRYWLQPHNPLADRFNAVLERHRGTEPMDYAYAVALMHYKGNYRSIPRALKYHADLAAGRYFGTLLGRRIAAAPHLADIDLVIPVPLHWTRRRSRGYNQSEILARAIVDAFQFPSLPSQRWPVGAGHDESPSVTPERPSSINPGRTTSDGSSSAIPDVTSSAIPGSAGNLPAKAKVPPVCRTDLLVRVRRTRTQTRLSVEQKARNVASAFRVPELFPLWSRLVSRAHRLIFRLPRLLHLRPFRLDKRWPIGVGHDEIPHSGPLPESPAAVLASAHHILLVDDTFTTGATLYACYAALRPYTTARISIATLAAVEGTPSASP